ncbi:MAG: ubiquinol oxidase subunit II [Pseudomonas fluorescens]|nr:MAG: ubiquinol oxidase subunit II [Pseudomonas fluorescens]
MRKLLKHCTSAAFAAVLTGCEWTVLQPSGDIAAQQRDLLVISTVLMLLIIIPVMYLTIHFAWKYRASNTEAEYEPEWDHSTKLELVIWACPLLIIICLGAITWLGTHLLDPYRPLNRIADGQHITEEVKPLEVQVVALDWKWLFIYPEYGIATVNELAAPVDRPINFRITASSVMNAFYVPALAGMIYAMPGMETKLHAVINKPGNYLGFSANYSGDGFSGMKFRFHGLDTAGFDNWVATVKSSTQNLDRNLYLTKLEVPSEHEPVAHYGTVAADLYPAILNMCVNPGKMCMGYMMAIDDKGGLGKEGLRLTAPLAYDKYERRGSNAAFSGSGTNEAISANGTEKTFITSICSAEEQLAGALTPSEHKVPGRTEIRGYGLAVPANSAQALTGGFLSTAFHRNVSQPASGPQTALEARQ